jgi:hypothetical protein
MRGYFLPETRQFDLANLRKLVFDLFDGQIYRNDFRRCVIRSHVHRLRALVQIVNMIGLKVKDVFDVCNFLIRFLDFVYCELTQVSPELVAFSFGTDGVLIDYSLFVQS